MHAVAEGEEVVSSSFTPDDEEQVFSPRTAERLVKEESARIEASPTARGARLQASLQHKSADELLSHTLAAIRGESPPATPTETKLTFDAAADPAKQPMGLAEFEAELTAVQSQGGTRWPLPGAAPAADGDASSDHPSASDGLPLDQEALEQLDECEGTLSACELNIQYLRATIASRGRPRSSVTAHPQAPLDEAALTASLPPPRYDAHNDVHHGAPETAPDVVEEESEEEESEEEEDEALSPTAEEDAPLELGNRSAALREMCIRELGQGIFDAVHSYLRVSAYSDGDNDEQMRDDLADIMGESKLRWWPLVDQIVFLEECGEEAEAPAMTPPIGVF